MTFLKILVLILSIVGLGGLFAYVVTRKHPTLQNSEPEQFAPYTEEEEENIKLANELYNKAERPEIVKEAAPAPKPAPKQHKRNSKNKK